MKTQSEKLTSCFDYEAKHLGQLTDDKGWEHDAWLVIINGQKIEYKTGLGLREKSKLHRTHLLYREPQPKAPKLDDVLWSLTVDYDAGQMSFDDFCESFGYSTDSRKALDIYMICQESAKKLAKMGVNIEEARKAFENY